MASHQDFGKGETEKEGDPLATTTASDNVGLTNESTVLHGKALAAVFTAMLLSILLIALDANILATALPRIASDFGSFQKQGWVASAFIVTNTALLLPASQLQRIVPAKFVAMGSVVLFMAGSTLCGAAPNIDALIAGRAVAGVGAAGLVTSLLQILAQVTTLQSRARLMSFFGVVLAIATIIGPLIGGALTDHATWRWCFYINLPIGSVSLSAITFLLKASHPLGSDPKDHNARARWQKVKNMDWVGTILVCGAIVSLVYGFQTGGNIKSWNDGGVIASFVVFGVLTVILVFWERHLGHAALVPTGVFKSKSIYALVAIAFCNRFVMFTLVYYIPIFLQAAKDKSATTSGVNLLPLMLSVVVTLITTGRLTARLRRYWPFLVAAGIPAAIGCGLLYSINENTSSARLIGYQILVGVGIGQIFQTPSLAIQAEFKDTPKLISQASGIVSFGQFLGGTIGTSVAQAAFASSLTKNLAHYAPTAPTQVIKDSPTAIYTALPIELLSSVVKAYVDSIRTVFLVTIPFAGIVSLLALMVTRIEIDDDAKKKAVQTANTSSNLDKGDQSDATMQASESV